MRKVFCDHCGKELDASNHNTLDAINCFELENHVIGVNSDLCNECYIKREKLHARVDKMFLHIKENK